MDLRRKLSRLENAGPGSAAPFRRGDVVREFDLSELREREPHDELRERETRTDTLSRELPASTRVARLRSLLGALESKERRRAVTPSVEVSRRRLSIPGRDTPHGTVHVVERYLEPHHCHGRVRVADALGTCPRLLSTLALDAAVGEVELSKMLFLDTETTGLSGGTGTLAFLIGVARFEDQSLCVEQFVLPRPGEEGPMLRVLADRIAEASCMLSYNGKSFDWPLLRNRFVLNRVAVPNVPPHIDLLHCARRVFKRRLGDMRLVHLETQVLGHYREDDIDGALIPQVYLDFLRDGEEGALHRVLEHNAEDIVALAAIVAVLGERFSEVRDYDDPRDHLGFAMVAARASDTERAFDFARAAAEHAAGDDVAVSAHRLSADVARKTGDFARMERCLLEGLAEAREAADASMLHLSLAKYCEHTVRDFERALEHARHTALAEGQERHERRLSRLTRRRAKSSDAGITQTTEKP